ncbi:MAG: AbrB/MazE/SpoVT family DNA-binding domain-containing protein [Alphaproteobacteria bacterium]|jgi:antitoxin component of MazEF toxin-antitoxin module|nr:AbrB/MazE/SpoVT family DNA-binding domain-containing protein [Alphaproteobacteria bacterium]
MERGDRGVVVAESGVGLAVRLPKDLASELSLKPGDTVEIVLARPGRIEIARDDRRARALEAIRNCRWPLPADFRLDRDEVHSR